MRQSALFIASVCGFNVVVKQYLFIIVQDISDISNDTITENILVKAHLQDLFASR